MLTDSSSVAETKKASPENPVGLEEGFSEEAFG
jgi:hypothetical protein